MLVKVISFQLETIEEKKGKMGIILIALCEDGIIREFNNNVWRPYPINVPETNENE